MKGSVQKLHCTRASSKAHWTGHALRHLVRVLPALAEKAAVLLQGIVIAHPFIDGNKRAGLGCMLAFLRMNGVTFVPLADPIYDFVLQVTTGELREVEDMASCLRKLFAPHLG